MSIRDLTEDEHLKLKKLVYEFKNIMDDIVDKFIINNSKYDINFIHSAMKVGLTATMRKLYLSFLSIINEKDIKKAKKGFSEEIDRLCQHIKEDIDNHKI